MTRQLANQISETLAVGAEKRRRGKRAVWIFRGIEGRAVPLLIASLLTGCQHAQTLPHRYAYELFPQANSPAKECPDQYPDYVSIDDGTAFFLECWGDTSTVTVSFNE